MKLLLCELEVLLAEDSASAMASLFPNGMALLERLRSVAPLRARTPNDGEATLHQLLLPFLALHQIGEDALRTAGRRVKLRDGAENLIRELRDRGYAIILMSSAYEPYPTTVDHRLGLAAKAVVATPYPDEALNADLGAYALASISELGEDLCALPVHDIEALEARVERFFSSDISYSGFAEVLESAAPLSSEDWLMRAERQLSELGLGWNQTAALGKRSWPIISAVQERGGFALVIDDENERLEGTISAGGLGEALSRLMSLG